MASSSGSSRYAWYVVVVLSLINFIDYADRQILAAMLPAIREDLNLSDFQAGFLAPAFLIAHSLASIPAGLLVDRWMKRKVIGIGVALWSAATALSALAHSFGQLFFFRSMLGVGEAAYAPAANSFISDYFSPRTRSRVMGIVNLGMVVGGAIGMLVGTLVIGHLGNWRIGFLIVGLPGLLLAFVGWFLRESPNALRLKKTSSGENISWKVLFKIPTLRYVFAGGICITFCIGGLVHWNISFIDRFIDISRMEKTIGAGSAAEKASPGAAALAATAAKGKALTEKKGTAVRAVSTAKGEAAALAAFTAKGEALAERKRVKKVKKKRKGLASIALKLSPLILLAAILGTLFGGFMADRLSQRHPGGRLWVIAAGFILGTPLAFVAIHSTDPYAFIVLYSLGVFFFVWYVGPIIAVLHDVVPYKFRGLVVAIYVFAIHIFGDGLSPPVIGWISDMTDLRVALHVPLAIAVIGAILVLIGSTRAGKDMEKADREGASKAAEVEG